MGISERSPPDHQTTDRTTDRTTDHRDPFPVHGQQPRPPRFASLAPIAAAAPQQQQPPPTWGHSSSPVAAAPAAAPAGASLGFTIYATNRDILKKNRVPVTGAIFRPFRMGGIPVYTNMSLRCLLAKFFIFIFFILVHGVQSLILGHF